MGGASSMEQVADACRDRCTIAKIVALIEKAKKEGTHNSSANMRTSEGKTPLGWIMYHGNPRLLTAVLEALPPKEGNAMDPLELDYKTKSSPLNDFCRRLLEKNHSSWRIAKSSTAFLEIAKPSVVSESDLEILKLFLQIDPKRCNETVTRHTDRVNHLTPLQALCVLQAADDNEKAKKAVLPLAEELLSNGAEVNPYAKGGQESDPTAITSFNLSEAVQQPGAIFGYSRMPPLCLAAASGNEHMVALLIAAGADINATDAVGRTAIMIAAICGNPECFKLLISQPKIDLTVEYQIDGMTVLHYCIQQYRIRHKNAHSIYPKEEDLKPRTLTPIGEMPELEKPADYVEDPAKNGVDMRCMLQLLLAKNPQDRPPIALSEQSTAQMQKSFDDYKNGKVKVSYFVPFSPVCLAGFIKHVYFERNSQIMMEPQRRSNGTIDQKVQDEIIELLKPHFDEEERKRGEECRLSQHTSYSYF